LAFEPDRRLERKAVDYFRRKGVILEPQPGEYFMLPDKADAWRREGCQILTVGSSWVVSHAMVEMHNHLRQAIAPGRQSRSEPTAVSRSSYLSTATNKR